MKNFFAILLAAAMILGAFASCGEKGTGFEGTYKCTYAKYNADDENGIVVEDWVLELQAGSKGTSKRDGEEYDLEWTLDGENITVTEKFGPLSLDYEGTLKDGVMTLYDSEDHDADLTRVIKFELQK